MIGYLDKFTLNLKDFEGINYEELKNIFTFVTMKYFLIFFFSLITLNTFFNKRFNIFTKYEKINIFIF